MPMQKRKPTQARKTRIDRETRNAFRLLKRASKLCGDTFTGGLQNLPITLHYEESLGVEPEVIESHIRLVQYALDLLLNLDFSPDAALHIIYDNKATSEVIKDMYAKV